MTNDFFRNKPRYNDDSDFTTNAESYYKDLARKQKLIKLLAEKIWKYENTLKESLESIEKRLTDYIAENDQVLKDMLQKWDDRIANLDKEVSHIFVEWLEDGTLEQIINHDVLGNKADKEYVDVLNDNVHSHINSHFINVKYPPFNLKSAKGDKETDDYDALQEIINYVSTLNNGGVIYFPKGYYMISKELVVPDLPEKIVLSIEGESMDNTFIMPLNSMESLINLNGRGGYVKNIHFNGSNLWNEQMVKYCMKLWNSLEKTFTSVKFGWAKIHGLYIMNKGNNNSLSFNGSSRFEINGSTLKTGTATASMGGREVIFEGIDLIENNVYPTSYFIIDDIAYEISTVLNNKITLKNNLHKNLVNDAYEIKLGCGLFAGEYSDNNEFGFYSCHFIANRSIGLQIGGLYGHNINGGTFDYNHIAGVSIGENHANPKPTYSTLINKAYFENNGFWNIITNYGHGLTIMEPLLPNTRITKKSGVESIKSGVVNSYINLFYSGKYYQNNRSYINQTPVVIDKIGSNKIYINYYSTTKNIEINLPLILDSFFVQEYEIIVEETGTVDLVIKSEDVKINNSNGVEGLTIPNQVSPYILKIRYSPRTKKWLIFKNNLL